MTRINAGVQPRELTREHLIAEHREITRIPNAVRSGRANVVDIPATFRLGPGHVRFFYDKLGYLAKRYASLLAECERRSYKVTDKSSAFDDLPAELMNDWRPTRAARQLVRRRIAERLGKS